MIFSNKQKPSERPDKLHTQFKSKREPNWGTLAKDTFYSTAPAKQRNYA